MVALLLCTAWAAQAQNLTVKVNDGTALTDQASLQAAIEASNVPLANITSIEISAGEFTFDDWDYIGYLSGLKIFTITAGVSASFNLSPSYPSSITSVSINTAIDIGPYCFGSCKNLNSVSIPKVSVIWANAFELCSSLISLELGATPPEVGKDAFMGCPSPRFLKVPDDAVDTYKNADDDDPNDGLWYGWRVNEQPANPKIKVNGGEEQTGSSLQAAIANSNVLPADVLQLEVTGGDLLPADYVYIKSSLTALQEVNAPLLKIVGDYAFYRCTTLTTVSLPTATKIGSHAFDGCKALTTANLPAATSIGEIAFDGCNSLLFLELGSAVPTLSDNNWTFLSCPSPRFLKVPDDAVDTYKNADDDDPNDGLWYGWRVNEQPAELKVKVNDGEEQTGNSLQAIFTNNNIEPSTVTQLELVSGDLLAPDAVYINNSLTELKKLTLTTATEFKLEIRSNSLQELYSPSIKTIGDQVFLGCTTLTTVNLPVATNIGNAAFYNCRSLSFLKLGATPPTVEPWTFEGCNTPRFLNVPDDAVDTYKNANDNDPDDGLWYDWCINEQPKPLTIKVNGGEAISNKSSLQEAIAASNVSPTNVIQLEVDGDLLGPDATYISNSLTALKKLILTSATVFGLQLKNSALEELHSPSIKSVGESGFSSYANLTTVNLPAATNIGNYAFEDCTTLTTVTMPAATKIGKRAFVGCKALASVILPKVTEVGSDAFDGCKALTTINLPAATNIGNYAFGSCIALASVSLPEATKIGEDAFYNCNALASVSLPKVTEVGSYAFSGCDTLALVSLPAATNIGSYAFAGCDDLTTVSLPAATVIGSHAFQDCKALASVSLPAATNIGSYAFEACDTLALVSLPAATNIGSYAFYNCNDLTTVSLPAATNIGQSAFLNCNTLASVNLPVVTEVGPYAFDGCQALTTVRLPAATDINNYAFVDCLAFAFLELGAKAPTVGQDVFRNCPSPRYLQLLGDDGTPLTGEALTNAKTNYTTGEQWNGWTFSSFYTLTYIASEGGRIEGSCSQGIFGGQDGSEVEAIANEGYTFVKWSDDATDAKRTDSNVQANVSVTAVFEATTYTLTYTHGEGGRIIGETTQSVPHGKSGTEVEAVPAEGYTFVKWSDDVTTAKRTDTNVKEDRSATAEFEIITYTLTYAASEGGSINGEATQSVQYGQDGTEVEAVAAEGYRFLRWSDGLTTAKRTATNVKDNLDVTAVFQIITYTLTYTTTEGGSISGEATQTVKQGENGTEVEAVAAEGYKFVKWSDGITTAKRTDTNVQADLNVTAEFEKESSNEEGGSTGMLNTKFESLSAYPNPTRGAVQVEATGEVLLYNAASQLLQRIPAQGKVLIDLSGYPSGLYIIRVGNAVAKVVKR